MACGSSEDFFLIYIVILSCPKTSDKGLLTRLIARCVVIDNSIQQIVSGNVPLAENGQEALLLWPVARKRFWVRLFVALSDS